MSKPNPIIVNSNPGHDCASTVVAEDFTLRDLFAAAALMGQEANPSTDFSFEESAQIAYTSANAMLAERAKK